MSIEWSVRFGDVLVIASFAGWGLLYIFKVGGYAQVGSEMKKDIEELKADVKNMTKVLIELSVQKTRLDLMAERINRQDALLDELRHGKGYIIAKSDFGGRT